MAFALLTSVYAQEQKDTGINFESNAADVKLPIGDTSITQNVIDVGNNYANQMSGNKNARADVSTESCSQLIRLEGSTVNAQNLNGSKVTNAGSLQNYKNQFYKTDGTCLKYYKF
jgi:hypothetical protein